MWVAGAAPIPEGSAFSQLLLFLSLSFIKRSWLDFMGSQVGRGPMRSSNLWHHLLLPLSALSD